MTLKFLKSPVLECLDHIGVGRIRQNDITPLMKHPGFLEISYLHFSSNIFCPLPPFELNAFDSKLLNGIFMDAETGIFYVGLYDDRSVMVALVVLIKFDATFEVCGINDTS